MMLAAVYCIVSFCIGLCMVTEVRIEYIMIIFLAHRIRISEILPQDRKCYPTHAILPRTSSNVIMLNCILAYSGTSGSLF